MVEKVLEHILRDKQESKQHACVNMQQLVVQLCTPDLQIWDSCTATWNSFQLSSLPFGTLTTSLPGSKVSDGFSLVHFLSLVGQFYPVQQASIITERLPGFNQKLPQVLHSSKHFQLSRQSCAKHMQKYYTQ